MNTRPAQENGEYPQTKFFQACRVVFEGGGCRGAAHVGAYEAAVNCGVNVSEVAGTSAGSIVAALIGAGATPAHLLKTCAFLKFSDLLAKPKGIIASPFLAKALGCFIWGKRRLLGRILRNGSGHSSEKIQEWLDDRLAELLPHAQRPIKFKDLVLPTWVVATDLAGRRAKIWSTEGTPDESVALAVRCSSSIPIFFEPVQLGTDLYVDGGMLSNLPTFVFANRKTNPRSLGGRILAIQLEGNGTTKTDWSTGALVKRLIDTSIDGASSLQRSIQSNVSAVSVNTGDVSSTNFDISESEVNFLLKSGRDAMKAFVANEHSKLNDTIALDVTRHGEDEMFDDLVREMSTPGKRLVVCCSNTKWFWSLFPSVAHWAFAGAMIDIVVKAGGASARENHRRGLLQGLGARVKEATNLPFSGFVLSRDDDNHNSAFMLDISESKYAPYGTVYIGLKHRPIIQALLSMFDLLVEPKEFKTPKLTLKASDPALLVKSLKRGVNQYVDDRVTIQQETVSLSESNPQIKLIVSRIRSYKYQQVLHLVELYARYGIRFCEPAEIYMDGKYVSTIVPPVLEQWGNDLVAIEGNTRIAYLHRNGISDFSTLVVRGVQSDLPGIPVHPREVLLSTYDLDLGVRIKGYNQGNFRSVEGAIRPEN